MKVEPPPARELSRKPVAGRRPSRLLPDRDLERSETVVNAAMNRSRRLSGVDSYHRELRFDVGAFLEQRFASRGRVAWLDVCCGQAVALLDAARLLARKPSAQVTLVGLDLEPLSDLGQAPGEPRVRVAKGSIHAWTPGRRFDLVTCVHGLHYAGDKLLALRRLGRWLEPDGIALANIDLHDVRGPEGESLSGPVSRALRSAGCRYSASSRIVRIVGPAKAEAPGFDYLGADDEAGPNYTLQPTVKSYYAVR